MAPKVSVIVPVYNAEKWLNRCVDSILAQTFTDFELLLIDDGSKDNSGAICDEYAEKDSRVRVFHKPNGGVSSARNLGIDNANGEWLCFVDCDDEIANLQALNQLKTDPDIILFSLRIISNNGISKIENTVLPTGMCETKENYIKFFLHYHVFNSVCAKLIRRERVGDLRFDTSVKFGEDALFLLKLLKSIKDIILLKDIEYIYHKEEDYDIKYQCSIESSAKMLGSLFNEYSLLGIRNSSFEKNIFNCYRSICVAEWLSKPSLWNKNKTIASVYKSIKDAFPISYRLKYSLAPTIIYRIYRLFRPA